MAVKRGLNKAKGLASLFPQNFGPEQEKNVSATSRNSDQKTEAEKAASEHRNPSDVAEKAAETIKLEKAAAKDGSATSERKRKSPTSRKKAADNKPELASVTVEADKETADQTQPGQNADGGVVELRISFVVPNKDQPRSEFDEEALNELTESIRQFGVIQPLLVQKKGSYYEIIAGERRWRAARKAGLKTVPAVIRDYSEKETVEVSLIENIQRQDLNVMEEARAYRRLLDEFHMTQDEVAKRVAKSRTAVTNSVRLLNLEPEVQKMVVDGELSAGHARALLGLEDPEIQRKAAEEIVRGRLSVRETELLVKELLKPHVERKKKKVNEQLETIYRDLENHLTEQLGTKVHIQHGRGKRGKIEIEYYSQDDLNRIIDLIH